MRARVSRYGRITNGVLASLFFFAFCALGQSETPKAHANPAVREGALNKKGLAAIKRGDLPAARKAFESLVRLNPQNAEAHNSLGWVLLSQGEVKPAIAQFQTAIRLQPGLADAHINLS